VEARVLGALIEKERSTPEYYPLTINALLAACNQKNNRDPVLLLDEAAVSAATDTLRDKKLVWQMNLAGSRVPKYRHAFTDVYHVPDAAVALLAELLLRGAQTVAELRSRAERMHPYEDVASVDALLQELSRHPEGAFVARLAREPGKREARYTHLLCGPVATAGEAVAATQAPVVIVSPERLAQLEQTVAELQARITALETKLNQAL
jgi:uncharacterized protein YceH (UPF0502 family)